MRPARASAIRTPSKYVSHTLAPANNGMTKYAAVGPPIRIAAAMAIGRPAGYVGTIHPGVRDS